MLDQKENSFMSDIKKSGKFMPKEENVAVLDEEIFDEASEEETVEAVLFADEEEEEIAEIIGEELDAPIGLPRKRIAADYDMDATQLYLGEIGFSPLL